MIPVLFGLGIASATPVPPDDYERPEPPEARADSARSEKPTGERRRSSARSLWSSLGPERITGGQVEGMWSQGSPVAGAIHTVLAHPTDPDALWIGSVNGGIWRTENATSPNPYWTALSDEAPGLSIGAMDLDSTDPSHATLIAGLGRFSSYSRVGGALAGVLLSKNGGDTWENRGAQALQNENIAGVAIRGDTILAASTFFKSDIGGLFRSVDRGTSFTLLSGDGQSGLPEGPLFDLVGDPHDSSVFFASVKGAGVFRSEDSGATWVDVSGTDFGLSAGIVNDDTNNLELAICNIGQEEGPALWAGVVDTGQLAHLLRSTDRGESWTSLEVPKTYEGGTAVGLQPRAKSGAQGFIHFSILADPQNAYLAYLGGDRQPIGAQNSWPNSINATDYTGRLFVCDASRPYGSQSASLTHINTATNSAPHADSREMVFDARGDIVEVDDGGIYRRTQPRARTGDWTSICGNLQVAEIHSIDFDHIASVAVAGTQDLGTIAQTDSGSPFWKTVSTGDGGQVAVDEATLAASGRSIRYSSYQYFDSFRRTTYDADNQTVQTVYPRLIVSGSGGLELTVYDTEIQFYQPILLNKVLPVRGLTATDRVYESFDQFENLTALTTRTSSAITAMAYGGVADGVPKAGVVYFGNEDGALYFREDIGRQVSRLAAYPGASGVSDIVLDPEDWRTAYAIEDRRVFCTHDAGQSWSDATGNLDTLFARTSLWTIEYVPLPSGEDAIVVGGAGGAARMLSTQPGQWQELGPELPNAIVADLRYDATGDILVAGTMGRGAWAIARASERIGPTEPTPQPSAWILY